ncbi:hypothetical protein ACP70R_022303 [Stipagrostis hirtigluma subsp. patula]
MGNCCVTGAKQTTFKWSIDGFSSLLDKGEGWTSSSVFKIKGHHWNLYLNPRDRKSGDDEEYVSLSLELEESSVEPNTIIEAYFKLLIYDQYYGNHYEQKVKHIFQTASTSSGKSCMIPLKTLLEDSCGFFVNDSCVFGVEFIKIFRAKANTTSESLYVQKMKTLSKSKTYIWDFENFMPLTDPDYTQSIIMDLSRDRKYLSLYLKMKTPNSLPEDYGSLVEFTLSIKSQKNGDHKKLTGRCQFSSKAVAWGFEKFISLEDFTDSSIGYLVRNRCRFEAKVAIVGSSKTF